MKLDHNARLAALVNVLLFILGPLALHWLFVHAPCTGTPVGLVALGLSFYLIGLIYRRYCKPKILQRFSQSQTPR
jgi:hypothetical protein